MLIVHSGRIIVNLWANARDYVLPPTTERIEPPVDNLATLDRGPHVGLLLALFPDQPRTDAWRLV